MTQAASRPVTFTMARWATAVTAMAAQVEKGGHGHHGHVRVDHPVVDGIADELGAGLVGDADDATKRTASRPRCQCRKIRPRRVRLRYSPGSAR